MWILICLMALALMGCQTNGEATPVAIESETPTSVAGITNPPSDTATPTPGKSSDIAFLDKAGEESLRVVSYNINWDAIFPVGDPQSHELRSFSKPTAFVRVMRALEPDILCLQEINPARDPAEISEMLNEIFDSEDWEATLTRDNVIASHFDLLVDGYQLETNTFRPNMEQAAALVDLPDETYGDLDFYAVCAHFKASGNLADIRQRQQQADVVMSNVRDLRTPDGVMDLEAGTPIVVMGDFNVYTSDPAAHLDTLLTGDVDNDDRYGPDFAPDWDESDFEDALPSHNGLGEDIYTWRDDQAVFETGILDRIIYSDSVLEVENAFVLNTTLMSEGALEASGLQANDVLLNPMTGYYDHLPLVVDFSLVGFGDD